MYKQKESINFSKNKAKRKSRVTINCGQFIMSTSLSFNYMHFDACIIFVFYILCSLSILLKCLNCLMQYDKITL